MLVQKKYLQSPSKILNKPMPTKTMYSRISYFFPFMKYRKHYKPFVPRNAIAWSIPPPSVPIYRSDLALREAISNFVILSWNHTQIHVTVKQTEDKLLKISNMICSCSSAAEVSILLDCGVMWLGNCCPIFWVNVVVPSSLDISTLNMTPPWGLKMSGTSHTVKQCHTHKNADLYWKHFIWLEMNVAKHPWNQDNKW